MNLQQSHASRRHLGFGPFVLDTESGELTKHGIPLRLQGQPLQILTFLIRTPGEIVSREELRNHLWSGDSFGDFDHGLNAAINRLRQVLADSSDQPRYIETVPGRGYRFIAAVLEKAANTPPVPTQVVSNGDREPRTAVETSRKRPERWVLVASLVAASLVLAGYTAANRQQVQLAPHPFRFTVSAPPGFAMQPGSSRQSFAVSPDGSRMAFTAMDESGVFQTFIRNFDSLESRPLPNSAKSFSIFWAPDGQSLFLTVPGKLRRTALLDDSYQVLCDSPQLLLTGATIGDKLLISARSSNYLVPLVGGTPTSIKEFYPWPQLLPDGKHLLFTQFDTKIGRHRARVVRYGEPDTVQDLLETDSRVVYTPSALNHGTGYLLFVRAGNLLVQPFDPRSMRLVGKPLSIASQVNTFFPTGAADFSVSNTGILAYKRYLSQSQIVWADRAGKVIKGIGPANVNLKLARLSPNKKLIATAIYDVNRGVSDIWVINAVTGESRREISVAENPVWAPDSKSLTYSRALDHPPHLFLRSLGESSVEETLPEGYFQVPRDWTQDGRFIAYTNTGVAHVESEANGDVRLIDMAQGRRVTHLISSRFHEDNPAFSPDGRWLAFTSTESGTSEVYLQAFDRSGVPKMIGERHRVSQHGASALRWNRNGKELFYLALDGKIYSVPVNLSPTLKISSPTPLLRISTDAMAAIHSLIGFDVSGDGQQFLIPYIANPQKSEIVIIQNWELDVQKQLKKID